MKLMQKGSWRIQRSGREPLAEKMAQNDNCELTPEHWEAINILREYYAEYASRRRFGYWFVTWANGSARKKRIVPICTNCFHSDQQNKPVAMRIAETDRLHIEVNGLLTTLRSVREICS